MIRERSCPRPRESHVRTSVLTLGAVGLLLLTACDGGSDGGGETTVPEGYQLISHPDAEVAVPEDWSLVDDPPLAEADADAVEVAPPDVPGGVQLGASLWRYSEPVPEGATVAAANNLAASLLGAPGYEELRREPVDVAGSDEAHLIQVRVEATALGGAETIATYVVARLDASTAVALRLLGPEEYVPAEAVDVALETFRVLGDG
jgi:hypothetical protein